MISIDITVLVEICIFLVFMFLMNRIIYQPLLQIMAERKRQIDQRTAAYESVMDEKDRIEREISRSVLQAHQQAEQQIQTTRQNADSKRRSELSAAQEQMEQDVASHRDAVNSETETVSRDVMSKLPEFKKLFIHKLLPVIVIIGLAVCPAFTHASGDGHAAADEHHGISEIARLVDFLLMTGLLYLLLRKPVARAFTGRITGIRDRLDESVKRMTQAEQQKSELLDRKSALTTELGKIEEQARQDLLRQVREIQDDTEFQLEKIQRDAERMKDKYTSDARSVVSRRVVKATLDELETELGRGLDLETDRKLVNECIDNLDALLE